MSLEDFVTSELRKTKFYDKDDDRFYPNVCFMKKDTYIEMDIEEMVSTFVGQYAFQRHKQSDYKVFTEHVFDSPGLDIYITFVSYSEYYNKEIKIDSFIITSYRN